MALAVVQRKTATDSAGATGFVTCTPTSSITSGNALLVIVAMSDTTAALFNKELQPPSSSHNSGRWYLIGTVYDATFGVGIEAWVCYNSVSGSESITATDNGNDAEMSVYELSGVPYFGLDKSSFSDIAASTTFTSGSITTSIANALIFGAFASTAADPWTAGAGYSNMQNQSGDATAGNELGTEERSVSSTGSYTASATHTNSQAGVAAIIAIGDTALTAAACRITLLGSLQNTTSGTHTVTATPAVGDLIVIIRGNSGNTTSHAPTDNNSDGLGTYSLATSALKATSADLMEVWVRNALVGSASSTVFTDAAGTTTGGGLHVYKVTGMTKTGSTAIKQTAATANQAANATLAPTFGSAPSTLNPIFVAGFNTTNSSVSNMVIPNGFAHGVRTGYATPAESLISGYAEGGITGTAQTFSGQSPSTCAAVAVELDSSGSAGTPTNLFFF